MSEPRSVDSLFKLGDPAAPIDSSTLAPPGPALPPPAEESATVEAQLDALIIRLDGYLSGPLPCSETQHARDHLQAAQRWLDKRSRARKEQHVTGKPVAHVSR